MEIRVLEYFLAVAREQNISRAAGYLHLTQPTLSRQLKELEDELGQQLFVRGNRKITLTQDGMFLRKRAQEIVDLVKGTDAQTGDARQLVFVLADGVQRIDRIAGRAARYAGFIQMQSPDVPGQGGLGTVEPPLPQELHQLLLSLHGLREDQFQYHFLAFFPHGVPPRPSLAARSTMDHCKKCTRSI